MHLVSSEPSLAFGIQSVVEGKFPLQQLGVTESERAESMSDPSQSFARGVREGGIGIGRPHDLGEQPQRRIAQLVTIQDRVETDFFAAMSQIAARNVVNNPLTNTRPVCVARQEEELRLRIDKPANEPRAGNAIDFHSFTSNPLHAITFIV